MKPTHEELATLRKGLRKRKVPHVFDGMWQSWPGIGGVMFRADGDDFNVEWVLWVNGKKTPSQFVSFKALCTEPEKDLVRLEIGWLMHDMIRAQGQQIMDSIGGPNESWREAKPYFNAADQWKHWALVAAGRMIFSA